MGSLARGGWAGAGRAGGSRQQEVQKEIPGYCPGWGDSDSLQGSLHRHPWEGGVTAQGHFRSYKAISHALINTVADRSANTITLYALIYAVADKSSITTLSVYPTLQTLFSLACSKLCRPSGGDAHPVHISVLYWLIYEITDKTLILALLYLLLYMPLHLEVLIIALLYRFIYEVAALIKTLSCALVYAVSDEATQRAHKALILPLLSANKYN